MRARVLGGLLVISMIAVTTTSCGSPSPADVKPVVQRIAEWAGLWKAEAGLGRMPRSSFHVPKPPPFTLSALGTAAARAHNDAESAGTVLARVRASAYDETAQQAGAFTKDLLCNWFAWWVEDPARSVPDPEQFERMVLDSGLEVTYRTSPPQQVSEATQTLRNAIIRAQGDPDEEKRNAAAAAVCAIPLPV